MLEMTSLLPDPNPMHIGVLIALAVFVASMRIGGLVRVQDQTRRRATAPIAVAGVALEAARKENAARLMDRAAALFGSGDRAGGSALRKQLIQAGYFTDYAVTAFHVLRVTSALAFPLAFVSLASFLPFALPVAILVVIVIAAALLGLVLPAIMLDVQVRRMQRTYRNVFPDLMDLLVVCVESGQSVQSAIARVGQEMMLSCPAFGFNLHLLSLELRAGSTLYDGLISMQGRVGLNEVQSLAVLLRQSEELGSSISDTIRVFSDEMRDKRLMRAETRANSLPVKMTVPLGLFIFPVILLVILVPVIIRIKNAFV